MIGIVGNGFSGLVLAEHFSKYGDVVVIGNKPAFSKASIENQGRLHLGFFAYDEPRRAEQIRNNSQEFMSYFSDCLFPPLPNYYVFAEKHSLVSPGKFTNFLLNMGYATRTVEIDNLPFTLSSSEKYTCIETSERIINLSLLRNAVLRRIELNPRIELINGNVERIEKSRGSIILTYGNNIQRFSEIYVCAYVGTNQLLENSGLQGLPYETRKMCVFQVNLNGEPWSFESFALNLIDKNFLSILPSGLGSDFCLTYHPNGKAKATFESCLDKSEYLEQLLSDTFGWPKFSVENITYPLKAMLKCRSGRNCMFYHENYKMKGVNVFLPRYLSDVFSLL